MPDQLQRSTLSQANGRHVLISGASIAGPALAYWLHRYGFSVTVVEQSDTIRLGGYPIDLRGTAMQVADRMGLLPALQRAHIDTTRATFVDGEGREIATLNPEWITGSVRGRDVELPRGVLTSLLFSLTRHLVSYRFSSSIVASSDGEGGVDVTFSDGRREMFDLVIGADGVHSNTRKLTFGPEQMFAEPIGFCFAAFTTPNTLRLSREAICANVPGRWATLYAAGDHPKTLFTLLAFAHPYALGKEGHDPTFQRDLTAKAFAGAGWKLPELIAEMRTAEDFYFNSVQQIRMPAWAKGRVALVGDAAYSPSFLTGQGSSLALVGAYVLASELALHADHRDAFVAYQRKLRPFVEMNQASIATGKVGMIPMTPEQLMARNARLVELSRSTAAQANTPRAAHSAFDLGEYDGIEASSFTSRAAAR